MKPHDLKSISEHISYEVQMFELAADKIKKSSLDTLETNVYLESFLVHARCLVDFLYQDEETQPDDVLAIHFFDNPKQFQNDRPVIRELIKFLKSRTGKEIAHLTYKRVGLTPEMKSWNLVEIKDELNKALVVFFDRLTEEQRKRFPVVVVK